MIDERKLIAKLERWAKKSKEESGLKEPALLQKVIDEVRAMAVNKEIKELILSRLVDTFSSRILYPMLLLSGNYSIAVV